ncbi:hypothetical protein J3F83DRAFT_281511 [Trichoderma novae-zelandiae]
MLNSRTPSPFFGYASEHDGVLSGCVCWRQTLYMCVTCRLSALCCFHAVGSDGRQTGVSVKAEWLSGPRSPQRMATLERLSTSTLMPLTFARSNPVRSRPCKRMSGYGVQGVEWTPFYRSSYMYATRLQCSAVQSSAVQRAIGDLLISKRQVEPNDDHGAAIRQLRRITPRMRLNACVPSWRHSPTDVLWASIVANDVEPPTRFYWNGRLEGVDGVLCGSPGPSLLRRGPVSATMFVLKNNDWSLLTTPFAFNAM